MKRVWNFFETTPLEAKRIGFSFARAFVGAMTIAAIGYLTHWLDGSNAILGGLAAAGVTAGTRAAQLRKTTWETDPRLKEPPADAQVLTDDKPTTNLDSAV